MPTPNTAPMRPHASFPTMAVVGLLALGIVPVLSLFVIDKVLDRGCTVSDRIDGEAGPTMLWRIETQRCGDGPVVTNVLLAPRGKSFALVASSTGVPRPQSVHRAPDGSTLLVLERQGAKEADVHVLMLKSTGRPAQPLVLANGRPKS